MHRKGNRHLKKLGLFFVAIIAIGILTGVASKTLVGPSREGSFAAHSLSWGIFGALVYVKMYSPFCNPCTFKLDSSGAKLFFFGGGLGLIETIAMLVIASSLGGTVVYVGGGTDLFQIATYSLGVALLEETVFRGVLLQLLLPRVGAMLSPIVVGLLFAVVHFDNRSFTTLVTTFVIGGLLFTGVAIYFRNLWASIGMHFSANVALLWVGGLPNVFLGSWSVSTRIPVDSIRLVVAILLTTVGSLFFLRRYFQRQREAAQN